MSILQNPQDVVNDGRENELKDTPELKVTANAREKLLTELINNLEDKDVGQRVDEMWNRSTDNISEYLDRQVEYLEQVDEFIDPVVQSATDWGSTIHLPVILTVVKTFHARMFDALMGIDPPFTVRSRTAANSDRAPLIQELMRYTVTDWANHYSGVEEQVDRWIWDWCQKGVGILKARWDRQFSRFKDVVETQEPTTRLVETSPGVVEAVPSFETVEKEVDQLKEVFSGPCIERVPFEDVRIIGGEGDPQKADAVIQQVWLTASELWSYADQKIFKKDVVQEIVSGPEDYNFRDQTGDIKHEQIRNAGQSRLDHEYDLDRYKVYEAYLKVDVDGSGINSDVIVWVHAKSRKILRATYLYRTMPSGMRPFFKIDFHKRNGADYGVGLVELLWSLGKEIDAIHNIKVDIGILTSLPWGFYRPSTSSMSEEKMPLEPGTLVPLDNPQTDVFFPNLGNRTAFGAQEEAALYGYVERLTSISDLNLGIIGGQGATRTATGTRALLGESNSNLNIFLKRMNRGWKQALKYLFHLLQQKIEPGFQYRIIGDDGETYWGQVESREELAGMYDFELEANSANSNKQVQIQTANLIYQVTSNPLDLQLGLISPLERYEAIKNMLKVNGIKDVGRYIRKPDGITRQFTPIEIADRILRGMDVPLDPTQDLQGFVALVQEMLNSDEILGQFGEYEVAALTSKASEAQRLLQAMQQQAQQQAAAAQMQANSLASQTPGASMQAQPINEPTPSPVITGQGES